MSLVVYNTFSKKKETFKSMEPGKVKMYVCGPTVYDLLHIGNFRGAIFFNLVRNWLEKSGYKVTYVYNYTDVDDKIIDRANQKGQTSSQLSEHFIEEFRTDFFRLGLKAHDHNPKVTEYIKPIIEITQTLIKNGKAYVVEGEVFYAIDEFSPYGKLSGKNLEELRAGERVDVDKRKRNPFDFVLWKPSKAGEPSWDSPWGKGRPGWHIECSAMIKAILGDSIDIHGGGIDLIFPHHENEIAQGEGACGKTYCHYWMHNNFINMKDEKMSKSLGNVITARRFMDDYHPEILKYVMLSSHYRSMLNINEEKIVGTIAALDRVYSSLQKAESYLSQNKVSGGTPAPELLKVLIESQKKIQVALDDDFNTGEVMAAIFEVVRVFNSLKLKGDMGAQSAITFLNFIREQGALMALFNEKADTFLVKLDEILIREKKIDKALVEKLLSEREAKRAAKDWAGSDLIRDELLALGIQLIDGDQTRKWTVKK